MRAASRDTISMMEAMSAHKATIADMLHHRYIKDPSSESLFNTVPMLFCIADFNGFLLDFNEGQWSAGLGYTAEEMRAVEFINFVHPDDRKKTIEMYGRIKDGNSCQNWENRYRHKDGRYLTMCWFCAPSRERDSIACAAYIK